MENKKIEDLIKNMRKKYGNEAIMTLTEDLIVEIECISSGSLLLDQALGGKGFPVGRIIEVFGPESSGKTTIALHAIAEVQKQGKIAVFIDAEHALDPNYAKALGVKTEQLVFSQPNTGEEALDIAEQVIKSNNVGIVVIDSVAALVPKQELDGEMGASHVGLQARLMSQALRKIGAIANQTNTIVIFINQLREKVGVIFGNPEITPGGRALKFYSSIRIEVRKKEILKHNDQIIGTRTKIKVIKNKIAPPFKEVIVEIIYGQGISSNMELISLGVEHDIIKKAGSWYSYDGEKIAQGSLKVKSWLDNNKKIKEKIKLELIKRLN